MSKSQVDLLQKQVQELQNQMLQLKKKNHTLSHLSNDGGDSANSSDCFTPAVIPLSKVQT